MKKSLITLCLMALVVNSAQAVVNITWLSPGGTEITDSNSDPAPAGWLVQFIAIDNGATMSTPTMANPFPIGVDETLLSEQILNSFAMDGALALDAPGFNTDYDDALAGGFAYARVYNVLSGVSAGQMPTHYGVSQLGGNTDGVPLTITVGIDASTANNIAPIVAVNMAIVPEPSTYALIGFGGLVMFWRVRRKK